MTIALPVWPKEPQNSYSDFEEEGKKYIQNPQEMPRKKRKKRKKMQKNATSKR